MTRVDTYRRYGCSVAFVEVENKHGDRSIGTAFHVGDGVFVTAKHVVARKRVLKLGTTVRHTLRDGAAQPDYGLPIEGVPEGPYLAERGTDVALLVLPSAATLPAIPVGGHLDDWLGDEMLLDSATVMGYPPVPFSGEPVLLAMRCEINGIIDKYTGGHPHFIVSAIARGGFSGGPVIHDAGFLVGIVTESLTRDEHPPELGFMAVLSVEPIYNCLKRHNLMPACVKDGWDGLWDMDIRQMLRDGIAAGTVSAPHEFVAKVFSEDPWNVEDEDE